MSMIRLNQGQYAHGLLGPTFGPYFFVFILVSPFLLERIIFHFIQYTYDIHANCISIASDGKKNETSLGSYEVTSRIQRRNLGKLDQNLVHFWFRFSFNSGLKKPPLFSLSEVYVSFGPVICKESRRWL